ncbi:prolyl oligopeptidase family serine peptidase [Flavicella sp.]|uniref:carboxylesterase family protein n=1 Tax=Flavicella sp. TaxID=2957742 RepID=UPI003015EE27
MKSKTIKIKIIFLLFAPFLLIAQQKTGNIVEYFGKEKVNEVSEGKVIHIFKEGLALKIQNFEFNSSSFPKDPVFYKFLMNPTLTVKKNEVFDINFLGNELKWNAIKVDTSNSFNDSKLRSSYVYLSYKSSSKKKVLFEASGHSLLLINGLPHEGDHYDFGWNLIPLTLNKGLNTFVLKVGRFPRIRARIIDPESLVQFTNRDLTLPDILVEEDREFIGAIRVVNSSDNWLTNYSIQSDLKGVKIQTSIAPIAPMSVQKVPFTIGSALNTEIHNKVVLSLILNDNKGQKIAAKKLEINLKSKYKHHKRTFISQIDGSVQYYSVAPTTNKDKASQALFLSVHGASVEAVNQANAYKQKDWGNLVAPTNRRPFGFAWEDWGRLDALEVLAEAKSIFQPNNQRIYLTGHSMGGHGSWYLGATYPDYFAAIAPCAGYPDLLLYRDSFTRKRSNMPIEKVSNFGITAKVEERLMMKYTPTLVESMIKRAGTPSRTLGLIRNYLHHGVYILHGEKDKVVPTHIARDMRERLGKFHNDFTYYEYPDGTHWYGNHSVDWNPIFEFFKQRTIKEDKDIKKYEFYTGSPGVSSNSHFITIHQQQKAFEVSSFEFSKEKSVEINTKNVSLLEIDTRPISDTIVEISLNGEIIKIEDKGIVFFEENNGKWNVSKAPSLKEKGPHRNGGFKDAFRNNVVLVYASNGSEFENEWYFNRAKFDAETFWYRANGKIQVVKDSEFSLKKYKDRNVIIYGNKDNNIAWNKLLKNNPIQVNDNKISFGGKELKGTQWGSYFIVPRADSDIASVGVVTATGKKGMKAAYMNHYLVNGTTFPDVLIFDDQVLIEGDSKVKCAGFFGNDWSIETGDFEWN